jgi:hypothetical protein
MNRFANYEINYLREQFKNEIDTYKVVIGKYKHTPIPVKTSEKDIENLLFKYSENDMMNILNNFEKKYNYKLIVNNCDRESLAKMIYNLSFDPFYYKTPFELQPKYTIYEIENMSSKSVLIVCKQFNIDPSKLKSDENDKLNLEYVITAVQKRKFIQILLSLDKILIH